MAEVLDLQPLPAPAQQPAPLDLQPLTPASDSAAALDLQPVPQQTGLELQPLPEPISGAATTFGLNPDGSIDRQDNGRGSPRLGGHNTRDPNLVGVALPESELRAKLGDDPAAWRRARVQVNTADGKQISGPIVDLGPGEEPQSRGVKIDLTFGATKALGLTGNDPVSYQILPEAQKDQFPDAPSAPSATNLFAYHVASTGNKAIQGVLKALLPIQSDDAKRKALQDSIDSLENFRSNKLSRYYDVTPEVLKSNLGKITGAASSVSDLAAGPAMMIAKMSSQTYSDGYDKGVGEAKSKGITDPQKLQSAGEHSARINLAETAPVLTAYALGGKLAQLGADTLLPEAAGPLLRGATGAFASTLANLTVSGATRAAEGQPIIGDLQQNLTDAGFGLVGGAHEAFRTPTGGMAAVPSEAAIGLSDVQVAPSEAPPSSEATTPASDYFTGLRQFLEGEPVARLKGDEFSKLPGQSIVDRVGDWFTQTHGGVVTHPALGEIVINRRGVKDSIGHGLGRVKAAAFAAVPDILKHGQIAQESPDFNSKGVDRYFLVAPIAIAEKPYVGVALVQRDASHARFYLHEVALREALQASSKTVAGASGEGELHGSDAGALQTLLKSIFAVKPDAETEARALKLKLRARQSEAGFLNVDFLQGAADIGRKLYTSGVDFAKWSGEMLRLLGAKIRPHLEALWNSITGQNILPHARERGGAFLGPSQKDIEGAANDREKMRGHIATVQRMTEVAPSTKEQVESWYSPITLTEVNDRARATIDQLGLGKAQDRFLASRTTDANTMALGHHVALRLDALNRFEEAAAVRDSMAARLTAPAQSLWYISTIAKTSPEGLIREAQKVVTEQIAKDPDKMELLAEINRLQAQLAAASSGQNPEQIKAVMNFTLQGLAKVNKPGQRLTAARLNDLVQRNNDGRLTPTELAEALAKHLKIPRLTTDEIAKIKAAQKLYAEAELKGDPIMRLRRGMEMMDSVYSLVPRNFWDKVRATAVISMILHGKLPIRIGISNSVRMAGQLTVDTIENVPRDIGNVFTGQRTITADQLGAVARGLAEPLTAFRSGFEDAKLRGLTTVPAMKEGVKTLIDLASATTRGIQDLTDIKGRTSHTFSSRFGRLAEDTVTLIHNVVPYAFWNAGYKMSLVRQMRVAGVTVPTEEMLATARMDANRAIFQNETVGYHMLKKFRETLDYPTAALIPSSKGKYGIGTATIPFAKVPTALLAEGATWTPLGFLKAAYEGLRPLAGQDFRPKEMADATIKAAIGTGSLFLTGYWLARLGVVTGSMDDDKAMRAMMQSLGWGQYKVNLSELKRRLLSGDWHSRSAVPQAGDMIVNYNWAEPAAFPIAMGAHIAESKEARLRMQQRGRVAPGEILTSAGAGVQALLDNPLVSGVQQFVTNFGEGNFTKLFADMAGNVPGNFIPSLVRQTAQQMDNTVREVRAGGPVKSEIARIEAQIPGLSQKFPPRYDVFGEAVQRQNYGQVSLINTFFNPAQVSRFKANPEVSELMRLYTATASSAATPRGVESSLTITNKSGQKQQIQLDNQQLATYQRYVGRLSSAMVTRLMASPAYAAAPDIVRQNTLTNVLAAVQRAAKIDLFGDRPFKINAGSLTSQPSVSLPSPLDLASFLQGRKQGLNQLVQPGP